MIPDSRVHALRCGLEVKIYHRTFFKVFIWFSVLQTIEPPHDKTNNVVVHPAKTQISLGIRPVWSESSLSAWGKLASLATHWVHSKDSDQTGRMPRLIWVFTGRTLTLLVLSRGSSIYENRPHYDIDLCDMRKMRCWSAWPIFHSPIIFLYVLKTIWWINVIVWENESK